MATFLTSSIINLIKSIQANLPSSSSESLEIRAFKVDLEYLATTFERIEALLNDAEERDIQDKSVKLWLSELKDVAYKADDVLDVFHYDLLRAQFESGAASDSNFLDSMENVKKKQKVSTPVAASYSEFLQVLNKSDMKKRIEDIKSRLDEIRKDRKYYRLEDEHGKRRANFRAQHTPTQTTHDVKPNLYGRDIDKEQVRKLLLSQNDSTLSVVAIVGMGGIGKTTLVQLVFNDDTVSGNFDKKSWIFVSGDFDVVKIAKSIVEGVTEQDGCSINELSNLKKKLDMELKGKKLLLVLDDVWNERLSPWESVEGLVAGANSVRVLVTTRNDPVTKVMKKVHIYRLHPLPETECWQLFKSYAFPDQDPSQFPILVKIGEDIVKKCGGLPLAVKALGCLLRNEDNEETWTNILQSDLWDLPEVVEILPALKISYNHLPSYLKSCFAFLSIFPKRFRIKCSDLAYLWIAQGFIQHEVGKSMEEIAARYLHELKSRSLLELSSKSFVFYVKMHEKVHDLANYVSLSNGECGTVVDGNTRYFGELTKARHLSFNNTEKIQIICVDAQILGTLRTFLSYEVMDYNYMNILSLQKMTSLRVLRLNTGDQLRSNFLDIIGNLKCLRYLYITGYDSFIEQRLKKVCYLYKLQTLILSILDLERLPLELGKLVNLQSLILEGCKSLKELPDSIGNLSDLRHLNVKATNVKIFPDTIWRLKNLEAFYPVDFIQVNGVAVLKEFDKLRSPLCISGLRNVINADDAKKANLRKKHQIGELCLSWNEVFTPPYLSFQIQVADISNQSSVIVDDVEKDEALLENLCPNANLKMLFIDGFPGAKYPSWMGVLTKIALRECRSHCLPTLGQFPFLEMLCIIRCPVRNIGNDFGGINSTATRKAAFPQLQFLALCGLEGLETWGEVLDGDFPKLETVIIEDCKSLRTLSSIQSLARPDNLYGLYPSWTANVSFSMIIDIKLNNTGITCIPTLGQLPALLVLHIESCPVKEIRAKFCWTDPNAKRGVAFPKLYRLKLVRLCELEMWHEVLHGDFPLLKTLQIVECYKLHCLTIIPQSVEYFKIKNCDEIEFLYVAPDFERSSMLCDIQVSTCRKLRALRGLHNLNSPKILAEDCPMLSLPESSNIVQFVDALSSDEIDSSDADDDSD